MMRGTDLVRGGNSVECFDFIHDVFFSELETAMGGVVEALTTFEDECKFFRVCNSPTLVPLSNVGYHACL